LLVAAVQDEMADLQEVPGAAGDDPIRPDHPAPGLLVLSRGGHGAQEEADGEKPLASGACAVCHHECRSRVPNRHLKSRAGPEGTRDELASPGQGKGLHSLSRKDLAWARSRRIVSVGTPESFLNRKHPLP